MFYHIEGTVAEIGQNLAVIDCAGIGFALNTTVNTLANLKKGERARLFVSESIREDAFELFGFYSKSEKRCFDLLLSVSGIGPKAALAILSSNTPEGLALAIGTNNEKALTVAPGIGKKIAQRVILELKDKLTADTGSAYDAAPISAQVHAGENKNVNDAVAALIMLGYSNSEVAPVLKELDCAAMSSEQIIKAVLKKMVK